MLLRIHDLAKGWIAYVIFAFLILTFALWGIQSYLGGGGDREVAEVNGSVITQAEFQQAMQAERDSLRQMFGGQLPEGIVTEDLIQQRALDAVVARTLIRQTLEEYGFRVSDKEVLDYITAQPFFSENGAFSRQRYENILKQQRITKGSYEESVREQLRMDQLRQGVAETAFVTPAEKDDLVRLKGQTRELQYAVISLDEFRAQFQPSEEEITAFYEANAEAFMSPERVKIDYVILDENRLREDVVVTDEALEMFYQSNLDRFISPETRRAAHILVAVGEGEDPAEAKTRAEALVERIRAGEAFASVAREASDDTLSASNGGDIGYLARGDMEPQFEDVLFVLQEGQVSSPVRTSLGWQIITVTDIKPAQQKSLDEVRDQIEREYRVREAEERFFVLTEKLKTASFEQGDSLKPAAAALGVELQTSDWFTVDSGAGLAANPLVRQVAFSDRVLGDRRNSDLIDLDDMRIAVLRIAEHDPSEVRALDAVRDTVRQMLVEEGARDRVRELGEAAVARLADGQALSGVAGDIGATITEAGYVQRTSGGTAPAILGKAFTLPRPAAGERSVGGVQLANGDYALVVVSGIREGSADEAQRQQYALGQQRARAAREFDAFYGALEGRAEIKIYRENIE